MIAGVGFGEAGEFVVGAEIKAAAVYYEAADGVAVPADELGGRVHDDVGPPFKRADQPRRSHSVVDHERHAVVVSQRGDAFNVQKVVARIAEGFAVEALGVGANCLLPFA